MGALTARGYKVQPFKVGPDYIDPSYHSVVCGVPCRNLDSWLLTPEAIQELFHRAMVGKDIAVIEGVMGLYDGATGDDEAGSTAQLAKLLGLPVVLVVDASKASRSVGAMALGFKAFDPTLNLAGVILNGIAGDLHLELARPSLDRAGVRYLGYLPGRQEFTLPERHLGLIPTAEGQCGCGVLPAPGQASRGHHRPGPPAGDCGRRGGARGTRRARCFQPCPSRHKRLLPWPWTKRLTSITRIPSIS